MKIGIISDIHANLEALTAVLAALARLKIDQIICLGDLVGYGPNPNECIDLIRQECSVVLAGNHDYAIIGQEDLERFNSHAKQALEWTRSVISAQNLDFLRSLEVVFSHDNYLYVHASPARPTDWDYVFDDWEAQYQFNFFTEHACFLGHSHVPMIISKMQDHISFIEGVRVELAENCQYLINVGSVGQPRDLKPESCFGVLDVSRQVVELHRVGYPIEVTQAKMAAAKLPEHLASRLKIGY